MKWHKALLLLAGLGGLWWLLQSPTPPDAADRENGATHTDCVGWPRELRASPALWERFSHPAWGELLFGQEVEAARALGPLGPVPADLDEDTLALHVRVRLALGKTLLQAHAIHLSSYTRVLERRLAEPGLEGDEAALIWLLRELLRDQALQQGRVVPGLEVGSPGGRVGSTGRELEPRFGDRLESLGTFLKTLREETRGTIAGGDGSAQRSPSAQVAFQAGLAAALAGLECGVRREGLARQQALADWLGTAGLPPVGEWPLRLELVAPDLVPGACRPEGGSTLGIWLPGLYRALAVRLLEQVRDAPVRTAPGEFYRWQARALLAPERRDTEACSQEERWTNPLSETSTLGWWIFGDYLDPQEMRDILIRECRGEVTEPAEATPSASESQIARQIERLTRERAWAERCDAELGSPGDPDADLLVEAGLYLGSARRRALSDLETGRLPSGIGFELLRAWAGRGDVGRPTRWRIPEVPLRWAHLDGELGRSAEGLHELVRLADQDALWIPAMESLRLASHSRSRHGIVAE